MQLVLLGTSHQTASVDIREKLSFTDRQAEAALARLLGCTGILEGVILSTCNRTEIYAVTPDPDAARATLREFWCREKRVEQGLLDAYGYFYVHEDAIRHLHRVAAGIDSLIVGEGQILAQVKAALSESQRLDAAGQYLEALFQQAIKVGKGVRTETNIGRGSVSVSSAAVDMAAAKLGDLQDRIVLIYGAGKMSSHTIKALTQRGAQHVYIVNRTFERAQEAARRLGCEALSLEDGRMLHAVADVIICCTSAPHYLLGPNNYPAVPGRARMLIDIAVPRNIDPALAEVPGVTLIDLDGLEAVARHNREERANLIIDAEVLIEAQVKDFISRLASFQVVPTIQAFTEHFERLAADEISIFLERQPGLLHRDPRAALERFAHHLLGRLTHPPVARLKTLDTNERTSHAAALARLFDLEVEDATQRYLRKRIPQRDKARSNAGESLID
ncbi:MAG: glutamyl-tRNA reductase [Candidatus Sericytochromatia bacterium]|nr:glutamyl-tRNA reductase [Candidatus Sericytochromatia bacterium]